MNRIAPPHREGHGSRRLRACRAALAGGVLAGGWLVAEPAAAQTADPHRMRVPADPSCGPAGTRILCGSGAAPGEYRAFAKLRITTTGAPWTFCGGTLIAPTVVLTAAHCVQGRSVTSLSVVLGADPLGSPAERALPVRRVLSHESFQRRTDDRPPPGDVALVELAGPVPGPVQPLLGRRGSERLRPGTTVIAAGYGLTTPQAVAAERAGPRSDRLLAVRLPLTGSAECTRRVAAALGRTEDEVALPPGSVLCARDDRHPGRDACAGDSGGPLTLDLDGRRVQAGIISYGPGCGQRESVGVYTAIGYYEPWIRRHVPEAVFVSSEDEGNPRPACEAEPLPGPAAGLAPIEVTVAGGPRLPAGARTRITVVSPAAGRLLVFSLNRTTCRAVPLLPLDREAPPSWAGLAGGTRRDIPGAGRRLRVDPPFGPHRVYALILPAGTPPSGLLPPDFVRGAPVDGAALLRGLAAALRAGRLGPIAAGSADYVIVP